MTRISSVQSLSHVQLSVTPWTAARQASLSINNFWNLLKLWEILKAGKRDVLQLMRLQRLDRILQLNNRYIKNA